MPEVREDELAARAVAKLERLARLGLDQLDVDEPAGAEVHAVLLLALAEERRPDVADAHRLGDPCAPALLELGADRVPASARRPELVLLGERELRDLVQACGLEARELLAVERRPVEDVGELRAVALVVERELLRPRPRLDLIRRTRSPPRRRARAGSRSAPPAPRRGEQAGSPSARGSTRPWQRPRESRGRAGRRRSAWR